MEETLPVCGTGGGMVKTATVSFGQSMPEAEMHWAKEKSVACDLFLAIGLSLVVYLAAGFPALAKENRAVVGMQHPTASMKSPQAPEPARVGRG